MREMQVNAADEIRIFMVSSSDHVTPVTGATVAVSLLKKGATTFAAGAGTVTEAGGGWYIYYATAADTNTFGPLAVRAVATGCDAYNTEYQVKYAALYVKSTVKTDEFGTSLDLTSTMKASVNAEADTALSDVGLSTTVTDRIDASVSSRLASANITLSGGAVTVGTNNDKTGYSLTQSFPSNFSSLAINASGQVTTGAFASTLDFTTNMNNSVASYCSMSLNSYNAVKTSDLSTLATASALATVDTIVDAILVDTGTTIPAQITSLQSHGDSTWATATGFATSSALTTVDTVVDAIKAVTDKVDTMLVIDGAVYQLTANSLENAPSGSGATPAEIDAYLTTQHGSGSWQSGGTGSGANAETITITDGTSPLDGVNVWATTDSAGVNIVASGYTNASGEVTFMLDSGTYYIWQQLAGYNFTNPQTLVVS